MWVAAKEVALGGFCFKGLIKLLKKIRSKNEIHPWPGIGLTSPWPQKTMPSSLIASFVVILIIMSTDLLIDIITIIMSTDKVDKWVPTSGDGKFPHTAV